MACRGYAHGNSPDSGGHDVTRTCRNGGGKQTFPLQPPYACQIPVHLLFRIAAVDLSRGGRPFPRRGEIIKTKHLLSPLGRGLALSKNRLAQGKKIKPSGLPPPFGKT